MPYYEYECESCGRVFEKEQRITAPPKATCPACKSKKTRRLISSTSFQLKGSGWYVTDYGGQKKPKEAGEKTVESPSPEKSDKKDQKKEGQAEKGCSH